MFSAHDVTLSWSIDHVDLPTAVFESLSIPSSYMKTLRSTGIQQCEMLSRNARFPQLRIFKRRL